MNEITFQKVLYEDIKNNPGVYLIEVKNGKKYVCQSKNVRKRIQEHLREIFNNNSPTQPFHKIVHNIIVKQKYTRENINELFAFWLHPTSTEKEAEEMEAWYLEQIALNKDEKAYYNLWYGSQAELNNFKKEIFRQKKIKEKNKSIFPTNNIIF